MDSTRVVIIEDNPLTVRSLKDTINWAALDCELCGSAGDGESGKALILKENPDIVLTDICMPNLSGLDMIEQLRPILPDLCFIILTGYDQFQYASRAIKLGVFDYILKPIQNEEVERAVLRALNMMHRRQMKDAVIAEADRLQAKAQLLSLLTNMSHSDQDVHKMLDQAKLSSYAYYLMVIHPEEGGTLPQALLNGTDDLLDGTELHAVSVILYDSVVIYVMRDDDSAEWRDEAEDICELIRHSIPARLNIGVSELETSHHKIRRTYQQARQALYESTMQHENAGSVFYREDAWQHSEILSSMRRRVDELVEEAELSDESADYAARELVRVSGQQYSQLRALVSLYAMMLSKKYPCNQTGAVDQALSQTWFVTDEDQVSTVLRRVCNALKKGRDADENRCSLLTRNVLDYIRIHGAEKLGLTDLADKFHVSANYLSALVRKETGITFHEHIINAKMEIAHTMLADPRILVEEVAYAVGYSNYVSFYNVFKQKEHMTPTEYRNMLANN